MLNEKEQPNIEQKPTKEFEFNDQNLIAGKINDPTFLNKDNTNKKSLLLELSKWCGKIFAVFFGLAAFISILYGFFNFLLKDIEGDVEKLKCRQKELYKCHIENNCKPQTYSIKSMDCDN